MSSEGSVSTREDPGGRIEIHGGALVVPPPADGTNRSVQPMGVIARDGSVVALARTFRGAVSISADPPLPSGLHDHLEGAWMFLGPLFGHFGHFLTESLARLWAIESLRNEVRGLVCVPKFNRNVDQTVRVQGRLLALMGGDLPLLCLKRPTVVQRLFVPEQGLGLHDAMVGTQAQRAFLRRHAGRGITASGPERIYVSRGRLPSGRGTILCEELLEKHLIAEGYAVIHPQTLSLEDQIATYKAARYVVSTDCSPLHLLAFVGHPDLRVAVIARRSLGYASDFARQIEAFTGGQATPLAHLVREWGPNPKGRSGRGTFGEIDFTAVCADLARIGMTQAARPLRTPTQADVDADIERLQEREKIRLHPMMSSA